MTTPTARMSDAKIWALLAAYHGEDTSWVRQNTITALCRAGLIQYGGGSDGGNYIATEAGTTWVDNHPDQVRRFRNT